MWPGHEADHSLPSSAEDKNGGVIPPHPHMSSRRRPQLRTGTALSTIFLPYKLYLFDVPTPLKQSSGQELHFKMKIIILFSLDDADVEFGCILWFIAVV